MISNQTLEKLKKNGWYEALSDFWESEYWRTIQENYQKENNKENNLVLPVYPKKENIFRALEITPLDEVKCVILGQDPYHTPGMANGLAFGVNSTVIKHPPSLRNIVKKVCQDHDLDDYPQSGITLEGWAQQGVLLLNSCLTVGQGQPGSHINKIGWEKLVLEILRVIAKNYDTSFLLLGNKVQEMVEKQADYELKKTLKFNKLIYEVHPSPLSAYRGFFQSNCFNEVNSFCCKKNKSTINWLKFNSLFEQYGKETENIECFLEPWTQKDDFYEQRRYGKDNNR